MVVKRTWSTKKNKMTSKEDRESITFFGVVKRTVYSVDSVVLTGVTQVWWVSIQVQMNRDEVV